MLTGIGTVRDDDPQLNVRAIPTERQPLRVIVDARLETPLNARILDGGPVLVAAAVNDPARIAALQHRGADVVILPNSGGKVDLAALMRELGRRGLNEVMAESGFTIDYAAAADSATLEQPSEAFAPEQGIVLLPAVRLGGTRLIDNLVVRYFTQDRCPKSATHNRLSLQFAGDSIARQYYRAG